MAGQLSKRRRLMLEMVIDLKNNKKRDSAQDVGKDQWGYPTALGKWLRSTNMGEATVALTLSRMRNSSRRKIKRVSGGYPTPPVRKNGLRRAQRKMRSQSSLERREKEESYCNSPNRCA